MRVRWTPEAERDRAAIWEYLEARNPDAARRMDQLFSDAAAALADYPMLGHAGEVPGTRELAPHRSYRIVYEIVGETVWISGADPHSTPMAATPMTDPARLLLSPLAVCAAVAQAAGAAR